MNKKYIIFPTIMIVLSILGVIFPYRWSYYHKDSIEIIQTMDITGYTKVFCLLFLIVNIFILLLCLKEGYKGIKEGYNYEFNKVFSIIFIILTMINIFAFVIIRNKEEKIANNEFSSTDILSENYVYKLQTGKGNRNRNQKTEVEILQEKMENDPYYYRKSQIYDEIKRTPSKFERYLYLLIYWNYYNEDRPAYILNVFPSDSESYYAIYSVAIILSIVSAGFYIKNISDKGKNEISSF